MIIQCKQCRTKFRFDDSNMQGSGIWLRCSRCGHVYFQENPMANRPAPVSLSEPEPAPIAAAKEVVPKEQVSKLPQEKEVIPREEVSQSPQEMPSVIHRDEHGRKHLDKIMAARRRVSDDIDLSMEKEPEKIVSEESEQTVRIEETKKVEKTEKINKKISSPRGSGNVWKIALWSVLVIFVIPLVIYFFVLPQFGEQLINSGELIVKKINEYRGVSEPATSGAFINQMVKLQDVRYRRINNYILGQIGVLEGTAVNRAEYPLSRIQIKGEIVDAYSVVLGERKSFAGNILTDEELTNMTEEEISTKLRRPEGFNNSDDKIMPNGQIPFMIVFPNEPAGVIKTTVMTIGAERLL
jgi:predicted Zn finger-like uncharacterized protein